MVIEYASDGTTIHRGELPPKAKGNGNLFAALAAVGVLLAGVFVGLDVFQGHTDVRNHVDADRIAGVFNNRGTVGNAWDNLHEGTVDTVVGIKNGAVAGGSHVINGTAENFHSLFGNVKDTELGRQLTELYVPNQSIPELEKISGVKDFIANGQTGTFKLPDGDLLVQDHGKIFRLDGDEIKALSPELLQKHADLRNLREAVVGNPFDLVDAGTKLALGGSAGLGAAALVNNTFSQQTTASNPYDSPPSTAMQAKDMRYHNRITTPKFEQLNIV